MIVIVDYGMANLRSVQKAFEKNGHAATVTDDPQLVSRAEKLVLPGVGAFEDAIARLRDTHLDQAVLDFLNTGRPFLGICLGLQLLFDRSSEGGDHAGLGYFPGNVVRFPEKPGWKVPHMGWNTLRFSSADCPLFRGIADEAAVYFVHSYFAEPADPTLVAALADYPDSFCAAISRDHVFAVQFHPEKSQAIGLAMLGNFANL